MQNHNLPNTTFVLAGFAVVMWAVTAMLWNGHEHGDDLVIPIQATGRLELNTTRVETLCLLPGIGPRLARRIVQTRTRCGEFNRIEELHHISGIGPQVVSQIRPWVVCNPRAR